MKINKILVITLLFVFMLLTACSKDEEENKALDDETLSNVNESGMPIVEDPVTLKMFVAKSARNVNADWNDILIWNKYEDMTNINLEWEKQVENQSLEEKRNLALASGNLPDVFYSARLPIVDIYKYGKQGTLVELNDLIEKYAPNLTELMEENPEIRKAITFPNGSIYSMPSIVSPDFLSFRLTSRPFLNKEWLDALGMDMPETTEEFYQYLTAVKEEDLNGNGEADEVPLGGTSMDDLTDWLQGSFGVGNKGLSNGPIDLDPNDRDKVRFYANTDEYKEMLAYVHKLYSEKLIEQNIFTIESDQFLANATEGVYGSVLFYDPVELFGKEVGDAYEGGLALKGPNGDQEFSKVTSTVLSIGDFAITSENPNPAATVRWMDYFYSDEGARLYYMGVEDETYEENADGEFEYVDKIKNNPEGLSFERVVPDYLAWIGQMMHLLKEEYFLGSETAPMSLAAAEKLEPYVPDEIWPGFTYTDDENKVISSKGADIEKYVTEMRDKFISGTIPLSDWDEYVKEIEKMGLEDYVEIKQAAYDRYKDE